MPRAAATMVGIVVSASTDDVAVIWDRVVSASAP